MAQLIDYSVAGTWEALYSLDATPDEPRLPHVRLHYHRATMMPLAAEMAAACVDRLGWQKTQRIASVGCGFGWMVEVLRQGIAHPRKEPIIAQILSFGWSSPAAVEAMLRTGGYTNVVGCDISAYVQASKSQTEEADIDAAIVAAGLVPVAGDGATVKARLFDGGARSRVSVLNEDGRSNASRNRIKQALGLGGGATLDVVCTEHVLEGWSDADCVSISQAAHALGTTVQHFVMCVDPVRVNDPFKGANWKPTLAAWKALLPGDTFIHAGDYQVL